MAEALRWASSDFPGFVEVALTDAQGKRWILVEKSPVIGDDSLTSSTEYPRPVLLPCEVQGQSGETLTVQLMYGMAASDGTNRFIVRPDQVPRDL